MAAPQVTVLMTVYNGGEYFKTSIASVLQQTFRDFEFLIIDDCSRDQSSDYVRSLKDPRIRLINNENNLGQTRSLNKGLSLAKGRYVARIDADDVAFPTWLEKNLALLQAEPLNAVVSCKAIVIDGANKIQRILNTPVLYEKMILRALTATPVNHVGAVYKTDVIISFGGYDETFKIAADFELWSKLIRGGIRLASSEEPLVAVRVHERSISISERGRADIVEISEIMARNFKRWVGFAVSKEQISLLWKLNYATATLSAGEFQSGLALLCKAYQNIDPAFAIFDERVISAFIRQQKRVLYAKKAFGEIEAGHLSALRDLAEHYQSSEGWANMFSVLWLGSWLGRPFTKHLPSVYKRWKGWSARWKYQKRNDPEFIHL